MSKYKSPLGNELWISQTYHTNTSNKAVDFGSTPIGIDRMVNIAYEHARKVDECDLVGRTENVIKQYDKYTENNYWKILEGMIENYKVLKVLAVLIVGSGLVSTANVITIILKLFGIGE